MTKKTQRVTDWVPIQRATNGEVPDLLDVMFGRMLVNYWTEALLLRPRMARHGPIWTYGDLRDAITLNRWLSVSDRHDEEFVYGTRLVLDRWRELNRPEDYVIGSGVGKRDIVLEPLEQVPLLIASRRRLVVATVASLDDARDALPVAS